MKVNIHPKRRERKQEYVEAMGGKCHDCGGVFPACVYDFHHLDPSVKDLRSRSLFSMKKEDFLMEVEKCIMLCSNCHRVRHYDN